jgi:hypothetical protein
MNNAWIVLTAALMVLVGIGHSWLGEAKVMKALLAISDNKVLNLAQRRFLRGCWHIGTLAWFAMAGMLLCLGLPIHELQRAVLGIVAVMFGLIGLGNFLISRGRNPGWIGCWFITTAAVTAILAV